MVLPALRDSCLFVVFCSGLMEIAISQPCAVRLSGDLGLVSQISMHALVSRLDCFSYFKQTNKQTKNPAEIAKNTVLENLSFLRRSKSY
jgi:hypothetical protein